jgi:hypothetical protein
MHRTIHDDEELIDLCTQTPRRAAVAIPAGDASAPRGAAGFGYLCTDSVDEVIEWLKAAGICVAGLRCSDELT